MSGTKFVGIIPGVIDDQARDAKLSGATTGLYRLLIEHADRETGDLYPITVAELANLSRFSRHTVRRGLDELEAAGLAEVELHQGHDGRIRLTRHDDVIFKGRSRRSATRSRTSALGSRRSAQRSRTYDHGSRTSARANRDNADKRERRTESSSNSLSGGASSAAPPLEGAGGDGAANQTHGLRDDDEVDLWMQTNDRVDAFHYDLAAILYAGDIPDEETLVQDSWLWETYDRTMTGDGLRTFVRPGQWSIGGQERTAYVLDPDLSDPDNLKWISRRLNKEFKVAREERQRRESGNGPIPHNVTDITASDAYQRGVARARAALDGDDPTTNKETNTHDHHRL